MLNPFHNRAETCLQSGLILESNIYKEIAKYYDTHGVELTKVALNANIDKSTHPAEAWGRLFFLGALELIN